MSETISATLKVKLKPWTVPNFAQRDGVDHGAEASCFPVSDLDDDALEDLALAWVRELYRKAGRRYCPFSKSPKAAPPRAE